LVGFIPTGTVSATDVQAAIVELDTEKVAKAGDTMTGGLSVSGILTVNSSSSHAYASLNSPVGQFNVLRGMKFSGGSYKTRWEVYPGNNAAETGGNAGSNFQIMRVADDGATQLGTALTIDRATGATTLYSSLRLNNGVCYFGTGDNYLYWDGSGFSFGGKLTLGAGAYVNVSPQNMGTVPGANCFFIQATGGQDAFMSLHRPGAFGVNFGISNDNNLYYGGWSYGSAAARVWTSFDVAAPLGSVRMAYAGDVDHGYGSDLNEPVAGGVVTGMTGLTVYNAWIARYRQVQVLTPAGWVVAGYV
jgi:hypothetical protein